MMYSVILSGKYFVFKAKNDFWGIISTSKNIARIVIHEADENAEYPDCNIGYDSFRFHWFSITGISMTDSSQPVLKWVDAGDLATYCVESRASLNEGAWSPVAPTSQWPVTGQSWTNTAVTNKSKCFYRVNVVGE